MKKPPEIIPADKKLRQNLLLTVAFYVLLVIYLEPLIDYVLGLFYQPLTTQEFKEVNRLKIIISNYSLTIMTVLPMLIIAWFGYRVFISAQLPPGKMRLPVPVPLLKGKNAQLTGLGIILTSLLVITQSFVLLAKNTL